MCIFIFIILFTKNSYLVGKTVKEKWKCYLCRTVLSSTLMKGTLCTLNKSNNYCKTLILIVSYHNMTMRGSMITGPWQGMIYHMCNCQYSQWWNLAR